MLTDPGQMEELMSKLVNNAGDPGLGHETFLSHIPNNPVFLMHVSAFQAVNLDR